MHRSISLDEEKVMIELERFFYEYLQCSVMVNKEDAKNAFEYIDMSTEDLIRLGRFCLSGDMESVFQICKDSVDKALKVESERLALIEFENAIIALERESEEKNRNHMFF